MIINITGNDLDLTPAIKEHVEMGLSSLDKVLARFDADSVQANVVIARTTRHHLHGEDVYQAEINLTIPHKGFTAKSESSDARVAFDEAMDKLKHELLKYKDQITDYRS